MSAEPNGTANGAAPAPQTPQDLEAEVVRARAEIAATLDELTTRLSPAYQAQHLAGSTKQAAADAGTFLTGGGLPAHDRRRTRNARVLLGTVAAGVAVLVVVLVRRRGR